ncbi:reverse transcriptase domain-containing protein [Lysinibacillus sp. fls2-241-R2A-57]|uniref:reverse transcriptase domain-containing protein n=1 Tax=Lysinibacillus sp. fls2-241-R2A-57 TaxID=3040292 RepID=UPI0025529EE9|nr:reverse transcriptase domain-containing protein [Lysinibacillus sp. fls2-241-R2A-57]
MYIERWLKAPFINSKGHKIDRSSGTPQGGVISPVLANLFLHYAFDMWMVRTNPQSPFERYADDSSRCAIHVLRFKATESLMIGCVFTVI